jgi:hypothetical protein
VILEHTARLYTFSSALLYIMSHHTAGTCHVLSVCAAKRVYAHHALSWNGSLWELDRKRMRVKCTTLLDVVRHLADHQEQLRYDALPLPLHLFASSNPPCQGLLRAAWVHNPYAVVCAPNSKPAPNSAPITVSHNPNPHPILTS